MRSTVSWKRAIFSAQNSTRCGCSDTGQNAVTVIAWSTPSSVVVTTMMPLANCPATRRKSASSTGVIAGASGPGSG